MYTKSIAYDRETKDFRMELDGALVGFARSYAEAEQTLDDVVYDLLASGVVAADAATEQPRREPAVVAYYYDLTPTKEYSADPEGNLVQLCQYCARTAGDEVQVAQRGDEYSSCEVCGVAQGGVADDEPVDQRPACAVCAAPVVQLDGYEGALCVDCEAAAATVGAFGDLAVAQAA